MSNYMGIELGSTRIKAVAINDVYAPVRTGDYTWKSRLENGIWTYSLDQVWEGLRCALAPFSDMAIDTVGISGMMHGYLAFDENWNLLVPFRTWQNTITADAARELTALFGFNIPQRWSIAHLWQAALNQEEHISRVAHITTLAGYVHYILTGVNAIGIGEASGMFPIDSNTQDYNASMIASFDTISSSKGIHRSLKDLLPSVLTAGVSAGCLTEEGAALLGGILPVGTPFVPCEGDAGTGMTATNAVAPRTGNVSAGTSIFSMVVLEKPIRNVYEELDMVTTPDGKPVAMIHCNNCTSDINAWSELFMEVISLFKENVSMGDLFTRLYLKSLEGNADCSDITVYNYMAGEGITHFNEGRPIVVRNPGSKFNLSNFIRAQIYSSMTTLALGMKILSAEGVAIDMLTGHGGLFKTPGVGQRYLAAACQAPVTCMSTAGEGGPYGMALLAAYAHKSEKSLRSFLAEDVFSHAEYVTVHPDIEEVAGFQRYLGRFEKGLPVEQAAISCF